MNPAFLSFLADPSLAEAILADFWRDLAAGVVPYAAPVLQAIVVCIVTFLAARRGAEVIRHNLVKASADPSIGLLFGRLGYFAIVAIGTIWVLSVFNIPLTALIAALGAVSLAISLSLQDVLRNLVAGLYMLVEKPFRIGDRLVVRAFDGVVESVDVRTTSLRTLAGERVLVPNAILFSEVLVNHGRPPATPDPDLGQAEEGAADDTPV